MYNIITKKKRGLALSKEEIEYVINGYTKGEIPDYQMSALLMAIVLNKMNEEETYNLTMSMANSGDMLDLSEIGNITADKHSTGGVGDKTSLIVGPIVASLGVSIAKMSGRGLGHTGGTIDKLDSIPGFKTVISNSEFIENVKKNGLSIIAQSGELAPADKKIYALRDVTATVDNISLIASSIMSKKLAAGSDIITLDVKCGSGAFMKELPDAIELAEAMVDIGRKGNRKMYALLSDMNEPLGEFIGNRLEVYEAVKVLMNEGPADLLESCLLLSSLILIGAGKAKDINEGCVLARDVLSSGKALDTFRNFVTNQHGDASFVDNLDEFISHNNVLEVKAIYSGTIVSIDTEKIGMSSLYLGGGRAKKEDDIDFNVGLKIHKKVGAFVNEGDVIATIYYTDNSNVELSKETLLSAYNIVNEELMINKKHFYGYIDDFGYHEL